MVSPTRWPVPRDDERKGTFLLTPTTRGQYGTLQKKSGKHEHPERLQVSRRDFMKIAGVYGVTSTVLAAAGMVGVITAPSLAQAANSVYEKRFKSPAKYTLKFGGADKDARRLLMNRIGFLDFVRDIEERTDGAMAHRIYRGQPDLYGNERCIQDAAGYHRYFRLRHTKRLGLSPLL